jgi:hypothetical protein
MAPFIFTAETGEWSCLNTYRFRPTDMNPCHSLKRKLNAAEDLVSGENESGISVGCQVTILTTLSRDLLAIFKNLKT